MDLDDLQEKAHADALSAFLEQRLRETRTDTHAVIAPASARYYPFRRTSGRHVISVDDECNVRMAPAEPLRS